MKAQIFLTIILFCVSSCTKGIINLAQSSTTQSTPAANLLTTEKAQAAIDRFVSANGSGALRIRGGVREVPSENAAIAELAVEDFTSNNHIYRDNKWDGNAIFSKYSDGKWTLTEIKLTNASDYAWQSWKPVIEIR